MRDILFRGKDKDTGEWVYGCYVNQFNTPLMYATNGDVYEVDPDTVGQFIGLLDVNGERIFEDDIIRNVTPDSERRFEGPVRYSGLFCNFSVNEVINLYGVVEQYQVVGNVHDNTEG